MNNPSVDIYEKTIIVTREHLDGLGHVNNVVYLQWVQDIAGEHWFSKFPDHDREAEFWVVLEHHLQYKKQAFLNDRLTVRTFVEAPSGIKFPRIVEIYRNDEPILFARSVWCMIDAVTERPKRLSKDILEAFGINPGYS